MNKKILIVSSNYYNNVSKNLELGSTKTLSENNFDFNIINAPGCFEIPFLIKKNIKIYDAFIALGCIIRGETYHFELIANETSRKIMDLSIDYDVAIGFGILTCNNLEQALVRSDVNKKNKGREAALACIELLK